MKVCVHVCRSLFVTQSHCFSVTSEECDDDDDPEYNFLADIDEPDVEDYRDDKAVRITSQSITDVWFSDSCLVLQHFQ